MMRPITFLAFLSSWTPAALFSFLTILAFREEKLHQDLFGLIGFLIGMIVSFLLLSRFPKPQRMRKLIEKDFGAVILGALLSAGLVLAAHQLLQGPRLLQPEDQVSESDLVKVRGKPELSGIWSVNRGEAFRFSIQGYPLNLLIQTKAQPTPEEQEFVGSLERLFVGGLAGDELFTTEYAKQHGLRGRGTDGDEENPRAVRRHRRRSEGVGLVTPGLLVARSDDVGTTIRQFRLSAQGPCRAAIGAEIAMIPRKRVFGPDPALLRRMLRCARL